MFGISVLVPTFCRTTTLSEVVACYLMQDWIGSSELIIYNDFNRQHLKIDSLSCNNKEIKIYNMSNREETLGHKRNAMVEMSKYNIVTFWDDDDIYLPHRLTTGFNLLESNREATREPREWHMLNNDSLIIKYARPFGTMTLLKSVIKEVGGFPHLERLQDVHLVNKLVYAHKLTKLPDSKIIPSTIYRLNNVLLGGHVTDAPNKEIKDESNNERIKNYIYEQSINRISSGIEPEGEVKIVPNLKKDYLKMANLSWDICNSTMIER